MHIIRENITHVLVIKDGYGLEEESHMHTTIITAAAATIYSLAVFFCRRVSLFHICEEQRKY
jgi:hypothetical protein